MGVCQTDRPCTICIRREAIMHSHHTVPQSRGGVNSLQIILCPTCHNSIHGHAVFLTSQIRRGKIRKPKRFWNNPEDEDRARPYLELLVQSLVTPLPEGFERDHLVSLTVPTTVFEDMKMLQTDLGLSSMEKTVAHCINYTLRSKGLVNVGQSKELKLWFL